MIEDLNNKELWNVLMELYRRIDDVCDENKFYLSEYLNLMDLLDEILSNY